MRCSVGDFASAAFEPQLCNPPIKRGQKCSRWPGVCMVRSGHASVLRSNADAATAADKVAFLSRKDAYPHPVTDLVRRETHMSWIFLAGEKVYKLKKPVRFPYLDFSTLRKREGACRAELVLNRRLAPDVYRTVIPLVWSRRGFALGEPGEVVDWLIVMRRLDDKQTLEQALLTNRLAAWQLDRLVTTFATFYRPKKIEKSLTKRT